MSRISGRSGRLYAAITSGGTAEPIAYLKSWSLAFATGKTKVTAMGDENEVYVSGLPDAVMNYTGFYDNASNQLYTAAVDGVARKFYLYPDTNLNSQYWFGTNLFDMKIDADVDGAVTIDGAGNAASRVAKVG